MVRDEEKYQLATYYRKRGFSYSEIANVVGVSKGTVSNWLAKKAFSKKVKKDNVLRAGRDNAKRVGLLNKAKATQRTARYREAMRTAETEYKHYKSNPLFTAGLMLYMGEGDLKDERRIRVSSAKPEVHRIFQKFMFEFMGVEKQDVKFWLLLYPALKESDCMSQWTKALKLTKQQWYKNQVVPGNTKKQTLQSGVGNTIIGSTVLKKKLLRWIELASKELSK